MHPKVQLGSILLTTLDQKPKHSTPSLTLTSHGCQLQLAEPEISDLTETPKFPFSHLERLTRCSASVHSRHLSSPPVIVCFNNLKHNLSHSYHTPANLTLATNVTFAHRSQFCSAEEKGAHCVWRDGDGMGALLLLGADVGLAVLPARVPGLTGAQQNSSS